MANEARQYGPYGGDAMVARVIKAGKTESNQATPTAIRRFLVFTRINGRRRLLMEKRCMHTPLYRILVPAFSKREGY